jgi:hypothetical protein
VQVDFLTVDGRFADMDARKHADVLAHIEGFLNVDFYNYHVEIGKSRVIP